ncbi:GtrA family protein [uncultured Georgenia sp.]|uniref:GtrA family protein n=1 Tax=uncultured Georgenia sp. TaxID=378209 RepID=UPI002B5DFE25|nr:GtrA family protein [Actinomycetaceae bacterium]
MTSSQAAADPPARGAGRPGSSPAAPVEELERDADLAPAPGTGVGTRAAARGRWLRWQQRVLELLKFGTVGGIAFVVDVGLMNLLRFGPGEVLGHKPLTAKVVSVVVATLVSWLGNRYWAFADTRRAERGRELGWFLLVNAGGMLIAVGTLAVSHYVLDLTSPLADNIAANGVGLALGTAFRYVCYRYLVFTGKPVTP